MRDNDGMNVRKEIEQPPAPVIPQDYSNMRDEWAGCVAWVVENGVFAIGMFLMFSKTVDLMTAFAPRTIFGYTGVEVYYGMLVGVLVEGALFAMKLVLSRSKNPIDWVWNVLVVVLPFIISGLAQVIDSMSIRDTLRDQPQSFQLFVNWFVPSIPTLIIGLLIGKSIAGTIPAELMPGNLLASLRKKNDTAGPSFGLLRRVLPGRRSVVSTPASQPAASITPRERDGSDPT